MSHGGGTWRTQNKVMPGTYINFSSLARASATLSDRGVAAAPFELSWGPEGTVFEVTAGDFQKNSQRIFGYSFDAPEMLPLREIFCHATKVYCYRLGTGAKKAACTYAEAKYGGVRGNDIRIVIARNVDNESFYDVSTYLDNTCVDTQTVANAGNLVANDFVTFKTTPLTDAPGTPLTGGANAESISGSDHQDFLDKIEHYAFNALCCPVADSGTVALYAAFTKRVRDELGAKFQLVAWQAASDYEGVVGVWNEVTHSTIADVGSHSLVYWVAGAQAGVAVNKSLTNSIYDGELTVNVDYTQAQLEADIKAGKFMLHNVNGTVRVLEDINTLIILSDERGDIFQNNQTVRVCDQIANDVAVLFNTRYVGTIPNDASGRATLWGDIVSLIQQLERIRAVEDFDPDTVAVEIGDNKKAVLLTINGLNVVNAMSQLYMSVIIQ
ncbi:MAG: phage tail sheath family protein [Oscillospiraceae bacterium]|nr:phage tail sheath family protein [Oscillospiraceae bacterium]